MFDSIHSMHCELNYILYQHQQFYILCILMLSALNVVGTHTQLLFCFLRRANQTTYVIKYEESKAPDDGFVKRIVILYTTFLYVPLPLREKPKS
jgi:hypothetical protein